MKRKEDLDIETLEYICQRMELFSDHTVFSFGYKMIKDLITELKLKNNINLIKKL